MIRKYLTALILAVLPLTVFTQTIEEVTVTATRQAESLQDIALSVQAITGEDLMEQHIETAADLADSTPGVSFTNAIGSGVGIKLRGLILPAIGAATVNSTDLQINGHSVHGSSWSELGFLDAERLEILEGPQGTLYGKNTTTGLMNLISARPGAGNYLKTTVGEDGYTMVKAAADFEVSSNVLGRVAISKFDKDPVIFNRGTGNRVDNRDSYGARISLDWTIDDNNQLNFNIEKGAANDNRLNLGTSSCNRDAFFGCSPDTNNPEDNINRPVFISGSISNTFDTLTLIANGTDTLAASDIGRSTSIDEINKSRDAKRQQTSEFAQLEWITGATAAPGDVEIRVKASNNIVAYYQRDDNDHNNASGTAGMIGSAFLPQGAMTIASLTDHCFGTETNVQFAQSTECSRLETEINQFEINAVSDFDNHNFAVGAYVNQSNAINEYTIQTTGYQLLTDFALHPLASLLFNGSLDTMGGQTGYGVMAATVAAQATAIATAIAADGGTFGTNTQGLGAQLAAGILGATQCANNACVKDMPAQAGGLITDQRTGITNKAVYGEYYYTFMDNFKLTLGARYMDDRFTTRSMQGLSDTAYNIGANAASGLTNATSSACREADYEACWQAGHVLTTEKDYSDSYKAVLQYSYDQGMAYVSMTTGNRAGGANPDASKYAASKSTSYELGSKNILLDGRLKLNANIFRHEQDDSHYSVTRFSSTYVEPHDLIHQGMQLDTQFYITESLVMDANVLLTDSEFLTSTEGVGLGVGGAVVSRGSTSIDPHNPDQATSWSGALTATQLVAFLQTTAGGGMDATTAAATQAGILAVCQGVAAFTTGCSTAAYNVTSKGNIMMNPLGSATIFSSATASVFKELGGNKVPGVADMEASIGLTQMYEGAGGTGAIRLAYSFKDAFEGDIYNNQRFTTGAQEYIDLNATYEPNQGDWYLNLWAKNLADKRQLTGINRTSNLQGQVIFLTYSEGMRAGLDFGINF